MTFDKLDNQRLAVMICQGQQETMVVGRANYIEDRLLGRCLRISLDREEGTPELFLAEAEWKGEIQLADEAEYDYWVRPLLTDRPIDDELEN